MEAARLYAILDTGYVTDERWTTVAAALLAGGADLLQVRAKGRSAADRRRLCEAVLPVLAAHRTATGRAVPLIVNDDVELAASLPEAGAHIGQDDMSPTAARALLGPGRVLGWSTHSRAQAEAAIAHRDLLDYFAVGPVYPTGTKPDYVPVGLDLVRQVANLAPPLPWFAIGGINATTLDAVLAAGAQRVVIVSALLTAPDPAATTAALRARCAKAR